MLTKILDEIKGTMDRELIRALSEHGEFASKHEAWAKILEEYEEASYELKHAEFAIEMLKGKVFHDNVSDFEERTWLDHLENDALNGAAELIQLSAMASKYRRLLNDE